MMVKTNDTTELWRCVYWFPSNKYAGDEPSEYTMKGRRVGNTLVLESMPNDINAYMFVRLTIDGEVATGNWHETTSPDGEFKGALYSGAGQLVVNPNTQLMEGKWAGAGYDHDLRKMRVYTGAWQISPIREKQ
jgi:hypothetical protein